MRDLSHNEIEMVSGSGSLSNLGKALSTATPATDTPVNDFTQQFEDMLKAIGDAFVKIGNILNYYTNLFPLPGSSNK